MRTLLLHPEDSHTQGPWSRERWDRIIDLGLGGLDTYQRWSRQFACPVTPLNALRHEFDEIRQVRDLLDLGSGRLVDQHGLDWWELVSIEVHEQLEQLILLRRFAALGAGDEVYVSRPGFHADALRALLGERLRVIPAQPGTGKSGVNHYLRLAAKFPLRQLVGIFWDKYDAGYQFRGRFGGRRPHAAEPVVLLPTAYVNVSRTLLACAETLPETSFLLVATRPSGWVKDPPPNVATAWLRSYASVAAAERAKELADLVERWRALHRELETVPEFMLLGRLGYLEDFPRRFRNGLAVRDAWRNVLDAEPVQAVLSADECNSHTHIPLLLARRRGLPGITTHHGALDGRYMFKRTQADVILAKGRMEEDYLVRVCGIPAETVEVGAPARPAVNRANARARETRRAIVFFSEAYDLFGGRAEEFYRDVLPPLADLALATGRTLVVKLHPAESHRERSRMIARVLSAAQHRVTRLLSGPLLPELLAEAWVGITILSTTAVECATLGIPCFLCRWLEFWPYGYIEQFSRFGVARILQSPAEIAEIPAMMENNSVPGDVTRDLYQAIRPERLRAWFAGSARREQTLAARRV
jgi:hypothetical protein